MKHIPTTIRLGKAPYQLSIPHAKAAQAFGRATQRQVPNAHGLSDENRPDIEGASCTDPAVER